MLLRVLHEHSNITYLEQQMLRSHCCEYPLDEAASGCKLIAVFISCSKLLLFSLAHLFNYPFVSQNILFVHEVGPF